MRMYAYESGDRTVYLLADLLHNLPLKLDGLDQGSASEEGIMRELEARAARNGMSGWLKLRIAEAQKYGRYRADLNG